MVTSKGAVISFLGVTPTKPGEFWTENRHDCIGRAQVKITIKEDGSFETLCPTCGAHPVVFYEMGTYSYFGGTIIGSDRDEHFKCERCEIEQPDASYLEDGLCPGCTDI